MKRGLEGLLIVPLVVAAIPLTAGIYNSVKCMQVQGEEEKGIIYLSVGVLFSILAFCGTMGLRDRYHNFRENASSRYHHWHDSHFHRHA